VISKTIHCSCCGHKGPRKMIGTVSDESTKDMFTPQGHDPYSGTLYFRCPRCTVVVAVDAAEALEYSILSGHPSFLKSDTAAVANKSCPLPVWGGLFSGLTLFCLFVKLLHSGM
jgi:hypothetical protein